MIIELLTKEKYLLKGLLGLDNWKSSGADDKEVGSNKRNFLP
tara:strand:- start:42262 stop:42387 length:126 start_codon:yes stop_codon:yes gene_type:complete